MRGTDLEYAGAGTRGDDPCGRRDVERVVAVSARADDVAHGSEAVDGLDADLAGVFAHDLGAARDNLGSTVFARHAQRGEEGADLGRVGRGGPVGEVEEREAAVGEREGVRVEHEFLEERCERRGRVLRLVLGFGDHRWCRSARRWGSPAAVRAGQESGRVDAGVTAERLTRSST